MRTFVPQKFVNISTVLISRKIKQYQIAYQQVYGWVKKYQEHGESGLIDHRGKRKSTIELSDEEKAAAKLRHLEAENMRLQMENDFLKN